MIALHIQVTRCKASQLLMASSCTSLQTLPSKSISNLIITIDTYLAPRYLRWLSKVPKRGNTASHSNWIRCFYRSLMRIPFACFVQEPYLIAKLDSAEKAWKEMSVWFSCSELTFVFVASWNNKLIWDFVANSSSYGSEVTISYRMDILILELNRILLHYWTNQVLNFWSSLEKSTAL